MGVGGANLAFAPDRVLAAVVGVLDDVVDQDGGDACAPEGIDPGVGERLNVLALLVVEAGDAIGPCCGVMITRPTPSSMIVAMSELSGGPSASVYMTLSISTWEAPKSPRSSRVVDVHETQFRCHRKITARPLAECPSAEGVGDRLSFIAERETVTTLLLDSRGLLPERLDVVALLLLGARRVLARLKLEELRAQLTFAIVDGHHNVHDGAARPTPVALPTLAG